MSDEEAAGDRGRKPPESTEDPDLLALRDAMRDILAAEGSFELWLGEAQPPATPLVA